MFEISARENKFQRDFLHCTPLETVVMIQLHRCDKIFNELRRALFILLRTLDILSV